jgi:DNA-binding transcriptional MerR regulator
MFKIGDFSRLCRVPVSALRYYADIGLLEPDHVDTFTGYRYYTFDQLARLNRILALKDLGLSLEQIKVILTQALPASEIRGMLRMKESEMQAQLAMQQAQLDRVRARLKIIEQENEAMLKQEVVLKTIEPMTVLSRREIAPTTDHIAALMSELATATMPRGIQIVSAPFTIYHDEEFKSTDVDLEIVFPVAHGSQITIDLSAGRQATTRAMPAIPQVACVLHEGDYSGLEEAYAALGKWIESNGYRIAGPAREIYLRPPGNEVPLTEIQFPVER